MRDVINAVRTGAIVSWVAIATAIATPANAGGIPVFDGSTFAQAVATVKALGDQLSEMAKDYAEQQAQTAKLGEIFSGITGNRGLSDLLNGSAQGEARRYAATPIESFTSLSIGDGELSGTASGLQDKAEAIMAEFGLRPGAEIVPAAPDSPRARNIDLHQGTALAALTVAEASFDAAPSRLAEIESLIGSIDGTPDLKASVDLNTRMQGQVALLLNELVMLQALQLRADGVTMNIASVSNDRSVSTFTFSRTDYDAINAPEEEIE